MTRLHLYILLVSILASTTFIPTFAQPSMRKSIGFGYSIGEPTAFTVRARIGRTTSIDFGVGKSAMGYPRFHSDYLVQMQNQINPLFSMYTGVGVAVGIGKKGEYLLFNSMADSNHWYVTDHVVFAGRGVVGLNFFPRGTPIEFFAEINPLIGFLPKAAIDMEASVGVRFYP